LGRRSRKRSVATVVEPRTNARAVEPRPSPRAVEPRPERAARTEARNAAVRAELEPLAPGERPPWVTVAAVVATALATLNISLYAAGLRVRGASFGGVVVVGLILLVAAAGMWRARYWAVLGFEMLLGVTCVFASLSLLVASSAAGAVRSVLVAGLSGLLFWKLIRAMARLQMPRRTDR
jgi:hypothetical protein